MEQTETALNVAKGISEYGILVVIAAFFVLLSFSMFVMMMRWFRKSLDKMISATRQIGETNQTIGEMNRVMTDIAEGLLPETQLRIKNTSNAYFDLATEKVCRMIKRVREENHIADREATRRKVRTLLTNMYEDRNSRFDSYRYRGRRLSEYTNAEWIEWVAQVVELELYNEAGANNGRAYTNVSAAYDNIKLDFYHRLNNS